MSQAYFIKSPLLSCVSWTVNLSKNFSTPFNKLTGCGSILHFLQAHWESCKKTSACNTVAFSYNSDLLWRSTLKLVVSTLVTKSPKLVSLPWTVTGWEKWVDKQMLEGRITWAKIIYFKVCICMYAFTPTTGGAGMEIPYSDISILRWQNWHIFCKSKCKLPKVEWQSWRTYNS